MNGDSSRALWVSALLGILGTGAGCDGSGDSDASQRVALNQAESGAALQGRFLDSPVTGLVYRTSTHSGITGAEGDFTYLDGEQVQFSIGSGEDADAGAIALGSADAMPIITPLELFDTTSFDPAVVNMLRLLQSLDRDHDASNGIELDLQRDALPLAGLPIEFDQAESDFENDPALLDLIFRATGQSSLVTRRSAVDHFQKTLNGILGNPLGHWRLDAAEVDGAAVSDVLADLVFTGESHVVARYQWAAERARLVGDYRLDGLVPEQRITELQIFSDDSLLTVDARQSAESLASHDALASISRVGQVALSLGDRVRVQTSRLILESADGRVVLEYVKSGNQNGRVPMDIVDIDPQGDITLDVGQSLQLDSSVHLVDGQMSDSVQIVWQSSDESVLVVDSNGHVSAVGVGSATVTATLPSGVKAAVRFIVQADTPEELLDAPGPLEVEPEIVVNPPDDEVVCSDTVAESQDDGQSVSQNNSASVVQTNPNGTTGQGRGADGHENVLEICQFQSSNNP